MKYHQYFEIKVELMASRLPLWRQKIPRFDHFYKGDPKRQVLFPLFWMKMVKPKHPIPKDMVNFQIHPQMSKADVKQYLEKIYNVGVLSVRTEIRRGEKEGYMNTRYREEDQKFAYVQLLDETFEYPNIELDTSQKKRMKTVDEREEKREKDSKTAKGFLYDQGAPKWFT